MPSTRSRADIVAKRANQDQNIPMLQHKLGEVLSDKEKKEIANLKQELAKAANENDRRRMLTKHINTHAGIISKVFKQL